MTLLGAASWMICLRIALAVLSGSAWYYLIHSLINQVPLFIQTCREQPSRPAAIMEQGIKMIAKLPGILLLPVFLWLLVIS